MSHFNSEHSQHYAPSGNNQTNDNDAISLSSHPLQSPLLTQGLQHYGFKYHQLLSLLEVCLKFDRQSLQHNCNESIGLRVPLTTQFKGPKKERKK